jgi:hypothetical protein
MEIKITIIIKHFYNVSIQFVHPALSKAQDIAVATRKAWIALGQNQLMAQGFSVS